MGMDGVDLVMKREEKFDRSIPRPHRAHLSESTAGR
jgi:hypothetical protein